jgi:hypothetical protein
MSKLRLDIKVRKLARGEYEITRIFDGKVFVATRGEQWWVNGVPRGRGATLRGIKQDIQLAYPPFGLLQYGASRGMPGARVVWEGMRGTIEAVYDDGFLEVEFDDHYQHKNVLVKAEELAPSLAQEKEND